MQCVQTVLNVLYGGWPADSVQPDSENGRRQVCCNRGKALRETPVWIHKPNVVRSVQFLLKCFVSRARTDPSLDRFAYSFRAWSGTVGIYCAEPGREIRGRPETEEALTIPMASVVSACRERPGSESRWLKTQLGLRSMPVLFAASLSPAGSQTRRRVQEGR